MRRYPLLLAFGVTSLLACGARTGLLLPEDQDARSADAEVDVGPGDVTMPEEPDAREDGHDASVERDAREEDAPAFPDGPDECPDAGSTLVYLITSSNLLLSFYPPTAAFTVIGAIDCPDPEHTQPFSMAVDRTGVAYVVFESGRLYRVSTLTAACVATSYAPAEHGLTLRYGMGFSANGPGDGGETLFVATDPGWTRGVPLPSTLATIDPQTYTGALLHEFMPTIAEPELTGTGGGQLYAFWAPTPTSEASIVQIDKATAAVTTVAALPGVTFGTGWAFAYWGGDFYTFTAPGPASVVTRYRPSDGSIARVATAPGVIVGAGVSTCAPMQ